MAKDFIRLKKLHSEFKYFIERIHGFYLDCLIGSEFLLRYIDREQNYIRKLFVDDGDYTNVFGKPIWDAHSFSPEQMLSQFGKSSKGKSYAGSGMYRTTLGEMKYRNKPDGQNRLYLGNMCIVMLCAYWECYFRKALTKAMGVEKDIEEPIWGDLTKFRNAILHKKGKVDFCVEKIEVLQWYKKGNTIKIDQEKFRDIILSLQFFGNRIQQESRPRKSIQIRTLKHKT